MNKSAARKRARESEYTWGDLQRLVSDTRRNGMSVVNPKFTKAEILDMFTEAIAGQNPDTTVERFTDRYFSKSGYHANVLTATNIFRECT